LHSTFQTWCTSIKGDLIQVEKEVRNPTAGVDEIRIYDVTSNVPDVTGYDEMSRGLTFNDDVRIIVDGNTLTRNVDFTVVDAPSTDTVRNPGGTAITITLTNPLALFSSATVGSEIHVVYSATINEYAVTGVDGNPNVVRIQYSNDRFNNSEFGETPRDDQSTATVFTFDLQLIKVDAIDNNIRLEDAIFSLYTTTQPTDGEGNPITVTQRDHEGTTLYQISYTLRSDENGYVRWMRNGNPYNITIGAGTFYLFETHAPAGFYRMYEPIIFEVDADVDGNTLNSVTVTSNDVNFDVQNNRVIRANVVNYGDEYGLPSTGGIGRTIFMTVGGIVILGSLAGMLISNRKKVKESQ
jgi:fimbrial isopeptide formation D2 family protein/LPXTG-motif cell wall-anchored protein